MNEGLNIFKHATLLFLLFYSKKRKYQKPMTSTASTPAEYLESLDPDRKEALSKLRNAILKSLPAGFEECMNYGMLGYVIPHSIYPAGYHCDPKLPLPFLALASQKNFIAFYHMGIYANQGLMDWFTAEWPKYSTRKLDMGKSCIRFKYLNEIPVDLIAKLCEKVSVEQWISTYESAFRKA